MLSFHNDPKMKDTTTIKRAAQYLESKGWRVFDIKSDNANGPDLTIMKDKITYRVEIKKVLIGKKYCSIKAVTGSGLKSDAIGILLPNNTVILQPMKEHLALCPKSGVRGVTELVRLNG